MRVETLPKNIQELLCDEECRQYLSFSSGDSFEISGVYSYDEKRLLYGLPKEYSRLGTTLVDAIWFCHPVKLLLVWGQELYWSEADVYKCHIAGHSLFYCSFSEQILFFQYTDSCAGG